MKNINFTKILFFILILSTDFLIAQETSNFNNLILTRVGHLNKDKVLDSIVVKQDTVNKFRPYRLEIYLSKKKVGKILWVSTDKAISPEYFQDKNALQKEKSFSDIEIRNHVLTIKHDYENEHREHTFQLRGNKFKLIEYYSIKTNNDGKIYFETINFDKLIRKTKAVSKFDHHVFDENEYKLRMNPRYLEDLNSVSEIHQ
ncbi:hypothetical protein [Psychroflexus planctonicus]|uniref:Outer membrane lipoprotein-sorting protein n=1 Tax=Psychroflexus planctonicus TaxID=1526575 RepID=A0ABQ1SFA8_9FLAO|nr:hypothetical protein [Psychroflexus planctonicus]GGE28688.1 hypothetical protein GCM10010832_06660 [Psychroflexus planctonicus]